MVLCEHIYEASFVFNNLSNVVAPSRTSCLLKQVLIRDMARTTGNSSLRIKQSLGCGGLNVLLQQATAHSFLSTIFNNWHPRSVCTVWWGLDKCFQQQHPLISKGLPPLFFLMRPSPFCCLVYSLLQSLDRICDNGRQNPEQSSTTYSMGSFTLVLLQSRQGSLYF